MDGAERWLGKTEQSDKWKISSFLTSDEVIVSFLIIKYADATPLYRQRAILLRDLSIDVALTTINDAVLRVGELLMPIVGVMKRDLLAGLYVQADETCVGVQTPDKKARTIPGISGSTAHQARVWYSTSR